MRLSEEGWMTRKLPVYISKAENTAATYSILNDKQATLFSLS